MLTLGKDGSVCRNGDTEYRQQAYRVKAVDTTAAGDTFTGFFLGSMMAGKTIPQSMELAAKASAIAVTRMGAAPSIPTLEEAEVFVF